MIRGRTVLKYEKKQFPNVSRDMRDMLPTKLSGSAHADQDHICSAQAMKGKDSS